MNEDEAKKKVADYRARGMTTTAKALESEITRQKQNQKNWQNDKRLDRFISDFNADKNTEQKRRSKR